MGAGRQGGHVLCPCALTPSESIPARSGQPDVTHLERSVTVTASGADVAAFTTDLKKVDEWSPWTGKDPNLVQEYSETTAGVGAWNTWSGNDDVGSGKMTLASIEDGKVVTDLAFYTPFEGEATATISWTTEGDQTAVTWAYDADADMMMKVMQVFMDMEQMLGPDYEKGLSMLKPLVEQAAKDRLAAEEAAKLAAAAEAAAEEATAEATE